MLRVDKDLKLSNHHAQFKLSFYHGSNSDIIYFKLSCNLAVSCHNFLPTDHIQTGSYDFAYFTIIFTNIT
jgi:hypothetical protein